MAFVDGLYKRGRKLQGFWMLAACDPTYANLLRLLEGKKGTLFVFIPHSTSAMHVPFSHTFQNPSCSSRILL